MRKRRRMINGLKSLIDYCDLDDMVMVEIGSYSGESTSIFAESGKFKKIYAVDPWFNGYDDKDFASHSNMEVIEKMFDERVSFFKNVQKIKATGNIAANSFENKSLDLVYIDACHTYEAVKSDIVDWLNKIKNNGYISGHDWNMDGVRRAVEEVLGYPDKTFSDHSWLFKVSN